MTPEVKTPPFWPWTSDSQGFIWGTSTSDPARKVLIGHFGETRDHFNPDPASQTVMTGPEAARIVLYFALLGLPAGV